MKTSKQKYIELSQAGFWFEIIINGLFLISGIISNLLSQYNFSISIIGIPLLLFNLLNIILKLCIFYKKKSIRQYSIILLSFIILLFVLSFISSFSMILRTLIFLIIYKLNLKYNYFIKSK